MKWGCREAGAVGTPLFRGYPFGKLPGVGRAGSGSGFRFVLTNQTSRAIKLAEPVPSSSHWYARSRGRWLWRASNGAGGSLVDAGNAHGRVAVYPPAAGGDDKWLTLPPHQAREWTESPQENPVLEYKPGVRMCSYPGESEYQVVFAYAYLAPGGSATGAAGLWIALGSGAHATEKLNSRALTYVNFL